MRLIKWLYLYILNHRIFRYYRMILKDNMMLYPYGSGPYWLTWESVRCMCFAICRYARSRSCAIVLTGWGAIQDRYLCNHSKSPCANNNCCIIAVEICAAIDAEETNNKLISTGLIGWIDYVTFGLLHSYAWLIRVLFYLRQYLGSVLFYLRWSV